MAEVIDITKYSNKKELSAEQKREEFINSLKNKEGNIELPDLKQYLENAEKVGDMVFTHKEHAQIFARFLQMQDDTIAYFEIKEFYSSYGGVIYKIVTIKKSRNEDGSYRELIACDPQVMRPLYAKLMLDEKIKEEMLAKNMKEYEEKFTK